ncbi:hypothetical protein K469DRAFT_575322 [Zopfia rhizophila CBS 207.26]|uniref:Uncharacterized protein n=1 Tax=Zopfia rhizophila CBS 207.26 TaxID=1314779 RepID=A0A6A6E4P8_9PEZI|nr:hypothetical protein K469DRAFT_575322 [Zopfia rhizophila CBS 207.26]
MPVTEPVRISATDLDDLTKDLITEDLNQTWHFQREAEFRDKQKLIWTTTDSHRVVLSDDRGRVDSKVKELCNKPTAFYWLQSAQKGAPDAPEKTHTPGIVFAAIYEEWRRCYDNPNIEFGHFLANPVRVTPTGPSTLQEVVNTHASLCSQANDLSLALEHYSIHPLYPAIVMVCDRLDGEIELQSDGYISLRKVAQKQSVLVVLTGSNGGLPISLENLAAFALPIERTDVIGLDVVRVPLEIAVKFFIRLEIQFQDREAKDCHIIDESLCRHRCPKGYDRNVCYSPDEWVHAMQTAAEKYGYGSMRDTQESVLRVRARLSGRRADFEFEHEPFGHRWKP